MQVFHGAAIGVNFPDYVVMPRADKQLGPAFEITCTLARPCQHQAVNATCILMQALEQILFRTGCGIEMKNSKQAPVTVALSDPANLA